MIILALLPEILTIVGGVCKLAVIAKSEQLTPKKTIVETDREGNVTAVEEQPMPNPSEVITEFGFGVLDAVICLDTKTFKKGLADYKLMDKERKDIFWLQMGTYACTVGAVMGWRERIKLKNKRIKELERPDGHRDWIDMDTFDGVNDQRNALVEGIKTDIDQLKICQNQINNKAVHPSWINPAHPDYDPADLPNVIINAQISAMEGLLEKACEA